MRQVVIIGATGRIFRLRCSSGLHRCMQSNCCVYITEPHPILRDGPILSISLFC